ncbi:MAG: hypothetical protein ACQESF_00245 [Nanobdellota archaeon]
MLGKKGVKLSLWFFVDIIFITILILSVFPFINNVKDSTYFEKRFFSKDLALVMSTIQGVNGDVFSTYSNERIDFPKYNYKFKKNEVMVSEEDFKQGVFHSYPFYDNTFLLNAYEKTFENPEMLYFSKGLDVLQVYSEEGEKHSTKLNCPTIQGDSIKEKGRVFIVQINSPKEAKKLSNSLENSAVYKPRNLKSSLETSVLIVLNAKESDDNNLEIFYLNNDKRTYSLGCNMKNELEGLKNFASVRFLPGLSKFREVKTEGFLALYISIQYNDEELLDYLGLGIKKGIRKYDENVQ